MKSKEKYIPPYKVSGKAMNLIAEIAGVDTVDEQIAIARRKGNIGAKEKVTLWRFEVKRHV